MIVVENVSVFLGGYHILNSIDLRIANGQRVALLGSNGAGKSTLLRAIIGMHQLDRGRVTMHWDSKSQVIHASKDGQSTRRSTDDWRRELGYIPQKMQLVGQASVLTNVVHGFAGFSGDWRFAFQWLAPNWARERAMGLLGSVGLADKALRPASSLSGGEAQRCAIARALVRRPKFLLADEPTASLDPRTRRDIHSLLLAMSAELGTALLVSSHIVSDVIQQYDRVVAVRAGEVVLDCPTTNLVADELTRIYDDPILECRDVED